MPRSTIKRVVAVLAASTALSPFLVSMPTAAAQENIRWEECPPQVDIASAQCGSIDVPRGHVCPVSHPLNQTGVPKPGGNPDFCHACLVSSWSSEDTL